MPYFNKKEIEEFIKDSLAKEDQSKIKLLTPIEQPLTHLKNEEDLVSFFFLLQEEHPIMVGSAFLRIDHDLYTNDRYALDAYVAAKENKTIQDVINSRENVDKSLRLPGTGGKNGNY